MGSFVAKKSTARFFRGDVVGYLLLAPALLFLLTFTVYPLIKSLIMSFSEVSNMGNIVSWNGLANWSEIITDDFFIQSVGRSLKFSIIGTVGTIIFGMILAQLLNLAWMPSKISNFMRGLSVMPWIFSMSVAALMWGLLLHRDGIINSFLIETGIIKRSLMFLGNPDLALPTLSVIYMWRHIPFVMVMIIAGLKSMPLEIFEAAYVDGANKWHTFWYITMPLLMPLLLTLMILTFVWGIGQFDLIRIITGGGPMKSTEVASYYVYRVAFLSTDWAYGSVISIAIFIINLIFSVAYLYFSNRAKPWR